jgi:predicted DNA-binding protein
MKRQIQTYAIASRVTEKLFDRLMYVADQSNKTNSDIIREALALYIDHYDLHENSKSAWST